MKQVKSKKREEEILDLVVESYIKESKPISSGYLCEKYHLPYSSATLRNIMESLERQGLLSHVHISSGRVPTQDGFRHYVEHLREEDILKEVVFSEDLLNVTEEEIPSWEEVFSRVLDVLAQISGYTSLVAISGIEEKFLFKGTRFILQYPEFEDLQKLRNLFYTLEVKIEELHNLLFEYLDEQVKVLIGDEIGCEGISECSLVVSGFQQERLCAALALLGPMRMDYSRAIASLYRIKMSLDKILRRIEDE